LDNPKKRINMAADTEWAAHNVHTIDLQTLMTAKKALEAARAAVAQVIMAMALRDAPEVVDFIFP